MSKPTTPGELCNVRVDAISLVSKAANKKTFKIFKSEKKPEEAPVVEKDDRGLFNLLKSYFTEGPVQKGDVENKYLAAEKSRQYFLAVDALQSTLGLNRYGDDSKVESSPSKIKSALSDFAKITNEILLGKDDDIQKFAEEVQKAGRKISSSRLAELKNAHAALSKVIEESGETDGSSEGGLEVEKKEIESVVKGAIEDALKPLNERFERLEKAEVPQQEESSGETSGESVATIVKAAISEAMTPVNERLEKIEKARGMSNRIPEDTKVTKDDGSDTWGDLF